MFTKRENSTKSMLTFVQLSILYALFEQVGSEKNIVFFLYICCLRIEKMLIYAYTFIY